MGPDTIYIGFIENILKVYKVLQFLEVLETNNNREWFNDNKSVFKEAEEAFRHLISEIQEGLSQIDHIATDSTKIFRIYRDVRFSGDKTPYHLHRSASFKRATKHLRGGYYFRIKRGESAIVGGFFNPNSSDMLHIRKQIQQAPTLLMEIIESKELKEYFGGLVGEKLKSAPRGFSKDDPAIGLLKYKQLLLKKSFSDEEVSSPAFTKHVVDGFAKMRPFFDYMSDILTTDLNGESLT